MKHCTKLISAFIIAFEVVTFISCDEVRKQVINTLATDEEKEALEKSETKEEDSPSFDPFYFKKAKDAMIGTVTISNTQKSGDGYNYTISADINNNTSKNIIKVVVTISSYDVNRDMFDTNAYNYDTKTLSVSISNNKSYRIHCSTVLETGYIFRGIMLDRVVFSDGSILNF